MESSTEYKEWIKRRNRNAFFSYFLLFLDGLETSAVTVVMLFYLQDRFHLNPDETRMFFSIAEMMNAVGQMTGGLFFGRYTDRTRNLRLVVFVNLWATIFGNLIYAIPFSVICIFIGRFLCGLNESLQVAFGGEFRRCYNDKDLINVLGWNEICYSIGFNIGPGAPILFTLIDFQIGSWKIDKYNAVHIFITIISMFLYIAMWFCLSNTSKELEEIKAKFSHHIDDPRVESTGKQHDLADTTKSEDVISTGTKSGLVMHWKQLVNVDIVTLCLSYGIMRYAINTMMSLIVMYALSQFHWNVASLSRLNIIASTLIYIIITVLIKYKVFQGLRKSYFCYATALTLTIFSFANLLLPYFLDISSYKMQTIYLLSHLFIKAWMYFHIQSSGKVLLFNTVSSENSCLIDGLRSTFGSMMRLFAFGTSFLCYKYPTYFLTPLGIIHFITACIIFIRFDKHSQKKKFE
ncbi:uncharacterized protein [Clytia hemisphaerica]|uniref:Uncharacterized protein n=1 Tax=Clytia hemisphaerica TaxID=252671 RepID=A0A7M5X7L8_9CNID